MVIRYDIISLIRKILSHPQPHQHASSYEIVLADRPFPQLSKSAIAHYYTPTSSYRQRDRGQSFLRQSRQHQLLKMFCLGADLLNLRPLFGDEISFILVCSFGFLDAPLFR